LDVLDTLTVLHIDIHKFVKKACVLCAQCIVASFSPLYSLDTRDGDQYLAHFRQAQQKSIAGNREKIMKGIAKYCKAVAAFLGLILKMLQRTGDEAKSIDRCELVAVSPMHPKVYAMCVAE
jgi:hypothetical protein